MMFLRGCSGGVLVTVVVQRLSFWAVVRPRPLEEPTLVEAVHEDAE